MNPLHDDERISAFLDGELSADEQSRFEQRLSESAELRQLVEELRALRGSLDLLPRHRLEEGFAEQVLRRAEQEMLASGESGSNSGRMNQPAATPDSPASQPVSPASPAAGPLGWKRRVVRPLVYAALAIGAAVLIMVFNPGSKDKEVARLNQKQDVIQLGTISASRAAGAPAQSPLAPNPGGDDKKFGDLSDQGGRSRAAKGIADVGRSESSGINHSLRETEPPLVTNFAKRGDVDRSQPSGGLAGGQTNGTAGDLSRTRGMHERGASESEEQLKEAAGTKAVELRSMGRGGAQPEQAAGDAPKKPLSQRSKADAAADSRVPMPANEEWHFAVTPDTGFHSPGQTDAGKGGGGGNRDLGIAASPVGESKEQPGQNLSIAGGIEFVECTAVPGAVEQRFGQLLANRGIAWSEAAGDVAPSRFSATEKAEKGLERLGKKPVEPAEQEPLERRIDQLAASRRAGARMEKDRDVEIVYIEGTADQIQGLEHDLRAESDVFGPVMVAAAPVSLTYSTATFGYAADAAPGGIAPQKTHLDAEVAKVPADKYAKTPEGNGAAPLRRDAPPAVEALSKPTATRSKRPDETLPSDPTSVDEKLDIIKSSDWKFGDKKAEDSEVRNQNRKEPRPAGSTPAPAHADKAVQGVPTHEPSSSTGGEGFGSVPSPRTADKPAEDHFGRGKTQEPPDNASAKDVSNDFGRAAPQSEGKMRLYAAPASPPPTAPAARPPLTASAAAGGKAVAGPASAPAENKIVERRALQQQESNDLTKVKREPSLPLGYARRLRAVPADAAAAGGERPKEEAQKNAASPTNLVVSQKGLAESIGRAVGSAKQDTPTLHREPASAELPLLAPASPKGNSGTDLYRFAAPDDVADGAKAPVTRMQAIFVFRLAPPAAATAVPGPPAQPPAAKEKK